MECTRSSIKCFAGYVEICFGYLSELLTSNPLLDQSRGVVLAKSVKQVTHISPTGRKLYRKIPSEVNTALCKNYKTENYTTNLNLSFWGPAEDDCHVANNICNRISL